MLISVDNDLWLAMWKNSQTDFHQVLVNPQLQEHWYELDIPAKGRVLVPLCGKSNDLIWLAAKGFQVIGIELSAIAVKAFFVENNLKPKKIRVGNFTVWRHGRISIYCGDIFLLKGSNLGLVDAVYDRAALTALPEEIRALYVAKLMSFMPLLKPMLLLTTEDPDPQRSQDSPAMIDQEVADLYSPYFDIDVRYGDQYAGELEKETVNKVYQMTRFSGVIQ